MRVLLLNSEYPPIGGGAAHATEALAYAWRSTDLTLDVVTAGLGTQPTVEILTPAIRLFREPIGQSEMTLHRQSMTMLLRYAMHARRRVRELLAASSYDLIHAFFTVPAGYIAYANRQRLPYIISLRGSDVPGFSAKFTMLTRVLTPTIRAVWRHAAAVVANSEGLRQLALATAPTQHISVIPNGVDTDAFTASTARPAHDELRLLTVARLERRKNIDILLRALVDQSAWTLTVVGDGPDAARLHGLTHALGLASRVTFRGRVPHDDLPSVYRDHDVFTLLSQHEGMANTLLEAMACGLPVVVTDTGGTAELVDNRNGRIVPIGDVPATVAALQEYTDPALRLRHGAQSRQRAERMSWTSVAEQYRTLYDVVQLA